MKYFIRCNLLLRNFGKAIFYECTNPGKWITKHLNLFPLFKRTRVIIDWYFQWYIALSNQLDHQFKIEVEAVALKLKIIQAVTTKDFKHGEWIFHTLPIQKVYQESKKYMSKIKIC